MNPIRRKNLFIASEVRSGSTYIAESISYALNHFFGFELWELTQEKFSTLDSETNNNDIINICRSLFLDKSGFSSAKLMCKALSVIHRNSDTDEDLKDCFFGPDAYWIVIRRRDRIAQAVSLAMARNSGLYHFYGDPSNSPDNQTVVNLEDITSALRAISLSDIYLSAFFDKLNPQNSIEIYYEDFMKSEARHVNEILKMCDLSIINEELYTNNSKLQKTTESDKINLKSIYADWLLKNYI